MNVAITTNQATYRRTVTSYKELFALMKFIDALSIEDNEFKIE